MEFTKDQRHTAYIIMLHEFESQNEKRCKRFCHLAYHVFGLTNNGFDEQWRGDWFWDNHAGGSINNVLDYFPELNNKEPRMGWPELDKDGFNKRKKWLQECIEETSDF